MSIIQSTQRTRIEMAAIAVPPVAISGSRRYSVSTVGEGGSFWYCGRSQA